MNVPTGLIYTETDEWVKANGKDATVGVSDYAQDQLSDVVYVEIVVAVGDTLEKGQQIATIESVKAAADVSSPISGTVTAVNDDLPQTPELVNKDPYDQAWMVKIEMSDPSELGSLMSPEGYEAYCNTRSH